MSSSMEPSSSCCSTKNLVSFEFKIELSQNKTNPSFFNQIKFAVKKCMIGWELLNDEDIIINDVTGGMTNYLSIAMIRDSKNYSNLVQRVLIRIFGNQTDLIIDRKREIENLKLCYKTGFGPKIYGIFTNGYVYQFFPGRAVSPEELFNCTWNGKLGKQTARWHKQNLPEAETSLVWKTIEHWLSLVPETYSDIDQDKKWKQIGGKDKIEQELLLMKQMASDSRSPIVFSHNDLLSGNIIVNEETDEIRFIDFEYAGPNYQAFDIANHFNEWAGFEADYSRYPNKKQQYEFYSNYLREYNGVEPSESDLYTLYKQVNKFALVSHFFWGSWSLVQASISKIDFDFITYARQRFDEYYKRKDEFLSL